MSRSRATAVLLSFALIAPPVAAQRVTVTPQIGIYIPTENLVALASGQQGEGGEAKLEIGPSFGARIGVWFGKRLGLEVTGAYVPTTLEVTAAGQTVNEDASLITGSGQAVFFLLPPTSPLSLFVSGGAGLIRRGGKAFDEAEDRTDISGVAGAGAGLQLGGIRLSVGADLFKYAVTLDETAGSSSSLDQLDVQLKMGVGFPMGGASGLRRR